MRWRLAPGTGYCETGGELVFLDLARDKYMALRGRDRAAFERLRAGEPNDSEAMSRLVSTGFLSRSEGPSNLAPTEIAVPLRDLSAHADGAFSLPMSLRAAHALRWARRAMKPEQIARTIARLAETKRGHAAASEAAAVDMALRYAACRWLVPVRARCLVDALALDRILLSRRIAVTLVFGVRLDPFAAHCWLQTPATILTGTSAEARNYTPIMVVG